MVVKLKLNNTYVGIHAYNIFELIALLNTTVVAMATTRYDNDDVKL